tara:strand:- start:4126 stop:4782 length:657 start_codon:yes stop_codon:yes gene_type:complete
MKINLKEFENLILEYEDIFWDYDDTLSNTVIKKGDAYVDLFNDYPNDLKIFIKKDHENRPGVSRYKKVPFYIKQSQKYIIRELKSESLLQDFSKYCIDILINEPFIKSFENIIRKTNLNIKHHILTNMPQLEIDTILKYKNLENNFKTINGSIINKELFLKQFLKNHKNISKIIFIGDSEGDLNAALANNIEFVLKATKLNKNLQLNSNCKVLDLNIK